MTYICELAEVHFKPAIGLAVRVYACSSLYPPVSSRRIHVTLAQTSLFLDAVPLRSPQELWILAGR